VKTRVTPFLYCATDGSNLTPSNRELGRLRRTLHRVGAAVLGALRHVGRIVVRRPGAYHLGDGSLRHLQALGMTSTRIAPSFGRILANACTVEWGKFARDSPLERFR
jgi:hypothetical protein